MTNKAAVRKHRYRARANGNRDEPYDFDHVCDSFRNPTGNVTCGQCGRVVWRYRKRRGKRAAPAKLTVGHLVPISRGGPDCADNVFPQCLQCNRIQAHRIMFVEWNPTKPHLELYEKMGRLTEGQPLIYEIGNKRVYL